MVKYQYIDYQRFAFLLPVVSADSKRNSDNCSFWKQSVRMFLFHWGSRYEDNILTFVPKLFTTLKKAVKWPDFECEPIWYRRPEGRDGIAHGPGPIAGGRRGGRPAGIGGLWRTPESLQLLLLVKPV
jgi:hypothetical protein